jgi:uncharacterized protein DUF6702
MVSRAAVLGLGLAALQAHPLHTSVTEVVADQAGEVRVAIRVYADDLGGAAAGDAVLPPDSAVARYVRGRFALRDRTDRPVMLRWGGLTRHDDAVVIRLDGALPGGLPGARLANLLLTDRFRDQVNVVRASWPGGSTTLLFTPGDGGKAVR